MKITINTSILQHLKKYITDLQFFLKPEFKTQAYNLHFYYSIVIGLVIMNFAFWQMELLTTPFWFHLVLGGFCLYFVNFVKEWYWGLVYKVPADFTDINFGSYGGVVAALLTSLLWLL
jgi:hypothetical protein